jgi:hypothetical protein
MAQKLLEENNKLKTQVKNLDKGYVNSEESRLQSQMEGFKRQYREAYDSLVTVINVCCARAVI